MDGYVWLPVELGHQCCVTDVTANGRRWMDSEVYRAILSAQIWSYVAKIKNDHKHSVTVTQDVLSGQVSIFFRG